MPRYSSDTSLRLLESNRKTTSGHPTDSQVLGKRQVDTCLSGRVEENRATLCATYLKPLVVGHSFSKLGGFRSWTRVTRHGRILSFLADH
jgi:hypothetical protein